MTVGDTIHRHTADQWINTTACTIVTISGAARTIRRIGGSAGNIGGDREWREGRVYSRRDGTISFGALVKYWR